MAAPLNFEFVVQSLEEPELSQDTKTKIRRQAMKSVIHARKRPARASKRADRKGSSTSDKADDGTEDATTKPSSSTLQKPKPARASRASSHNPEVSSLLRRATPEIQSFHSRTATHTETHIPNMMPFSGLDLLVSAYGIYPHDLSSLTTVHHNVVVGDIIRGKPSEARNLFFQRGEEDESFFAFVGQRYGHSECLDAALRCLFSKAKSVLVPDNPIPEATILSQYGYALSCLQTAVDSPSWAAPEVLCATNVMAIFELFNLDSPQSWKQHIAGAARLIQARGPEGFRTGFEKRLLRALWNPIICESWVNAEPCFLIDEEWREVFDSIYDSEDPLSERGYLAKEHSIGMARMPTIQRRAFNAISQDADPADPAVTKIVEELRDMHRACQKWRGDFIRYLASYGTMNKDTFNTSLSLFCGGGVWNILVSLFLSILDPETRQATLGEAIERSWEVIHGHQELPPIQERKTLFMAQRQRISEATVLAAPVLKETIGSGKLIEMWRIMFWFRAMQKAEQGAIPEFEPEKNFSTGDTLPHPAQSAFFLKMGLDLLSLT